MAMMFLEDAEEVTKRLITNMTEEDLTEEDMELIHNELEQKCHINTTAKNIKAVKEMFEKIDDIMPEKIAEAISKDQLRDYCRNLQVALNMLMIQIPINWGTR